MLLKMSLSGGILIALILVLRFFALNKLPKRIFFILWIAALLRLLVPVNLPFSFGITFPATQAVDEMHLKTEAADYPAAGTQTAEAASIPVSSNRNISSMECLHGIWILLMTALLVFFGVQYYREYKKMQTALPVSCESDRFLKMLVDVPNRVRLLVSDRVFSPLAFGMIFPAVIFPKTMDLENAANARYILTHEVIHIKRADNFWKIAMLLALCIHWFNPFVWIMWIFFNRDIELSCDEKVIEICGENEKKEYARTLMEFAEKQYNWQLFSNRFGKSGIQERMDAIMKYKKMTIAGFTIGFLLLGAIVTAFAQNNSAALEGETAITQNKPADAGKKTATNDIQGIEESAENNNGGNVDNVRIHDWKPSEIYSDSDIEAAYQTVKDYFSEEFGGCTLTKLYYPGDSYAGEFNQWAEQYNADEAIVIESSFDVDSSGGDGSLNPDSTYAGWKWILIRNDKGNWEHADHGY